ncbi:MAG: DUF4012 domain-containing protein [Rhodoglobus sp.]
MSQYSEPDSGRSRSRRSSSRDHASTGSEPRRRRSGSSGGSGSSGTRRRRTRRSKARRVRRILLRVGLGVLAAIVFAGAWVGIRGYLAKGELEAAVPLASRIQNEVIDGDKQGAAASLDTLKLHTRAAAQLTSDPIWRAAEVIPWAGANLTVVRELADIVNEVTVDGIAPVINLAGQLNLSDFKPADNSIAVQPLVDLAPQLAEASTALIHAQTRVTQLDRSGAISLVSGAADQLETVVDKAADAVTTVERATALLPEILGANGARNYLLLIQNPAELRAGGGVPGAMAVLHTDNGRIDLTTQASTRDFSKFEQAVLELPADTRSLYGDITGEYIQNVTLTPQFAISAPLAREMWKRQFGTEVDGVIAVDPVTLSYLLQASGPVTLPDGEKLSSDNAVQVLLSDVYARFPEPADQDLFFASAASAVFSQVLGGDIDPKKMIESLAQAGDEGRVRMWLADAASQDRLEETTLAGLLPMSDSHNQKFGVYFNDATGAKMDFYLDRAITVEQAVCRNDGLMTAVVAVTLTNTAPADAATSLPPYVTANGLFGVPPGNIRTITNVYGPQDAINQGATGDREIGVLTTMDSGFPVSAVELELAPGESATVRYTMLLNASPNARLSVRTTPGINLIETEEGSRTC